MFGMQLVHIVFALILTAEIRGDAPPIHVWPMGNQTLFHDMIGSQDIQTDSSNQCFNFVDGPPELPYSVLDLQEQPDDCFDINIDDKGTLRDLTISFYVKPHNDAADISGTLLHYEADERETMKIRSLANTFLVSFRDEYGMSAGMMYLVDFLTPHAWNHVTITRDFMTGRIRVFKDNVEMYNEDDEFSDVISFPRAGVLRLGKSLDPEDEDKFDGNFACLQIYNLNQQAYKLEEIQQFCFPESWVKGKIKTKFYYEENSGQMCLTDPPIVAEQPQFQPGYVVTMTTLMRESHWLAFLQMYNLQDSGHSLAYFEKTETDKIPNDNNSLGAFNATDHRLCTRLCSRVDGCKAANVGPFLEDVTWRECILYEDVPVHFEERVGSRFYVQVE